MLWGLAAGMDHLTASADRIERLADADAVWREALGALRTCGIEFVIYLTVDSEGAHPLLWTNVPEIYAETPPESDPFLSHCCDSFAVTRTGPEFLADHVHLPPEVHAFVRAAAVSGFRSGIGIPTRLAGSSRYGGFNLGTRLNAETFMREVMTGAEALRTFCLVVHRRIEELVLNGAVVAERLLHELTPRERELIRLVAEGRSRKECARLCGISPHTAAEYIQSAYRKLDVHSRVEAARLLAGQELTGG